MKKFLSLLLALTLLMTFLAVPAAAATEPLTWNDPVDVSAVTGEDGDYRYSFTYDLSSYITGGELANGDQIVLIVMGDSSKSGSDGHYVDVGLKANIVYINQTEVQDGKVSFEFIPTTPDANNDNMFYTAYLGGVSSGVVFLKNFAAGENCISGTVYCMDSLAHIKVSVFSGTRVNGSLQNAVLVGSTTIDNYASFNKTSFTIGKTELLSGMSLDTGKTYYIYAEQVDAEGNSLDDSYVSGYRAVTLTAGSVDFDAGKYTIWNGDVNRDGVVTGEDLSSVLDSFYRPSSYAYYNENADLNSDGAVTGTDLSYVLEAFYKIVYEY